MSAHINSSFGKNRIIYIGDAAHSIHPIAGQGWNLGMRDCENLKKIIIEALDLGLDIGSEFVCKEFNNARYFDVFSLYQVTDKLNSIFMNEKFIFKKSRQLGLGLIDYNKNINNYITKYAMGDIL